ncbi:hypothetical protein IF1G_04272 [Cordyceps javanica]|uniref:Uncharacterized protein n=1 Tax=Cordyceps javanica TaxID=43265 RepID=A0A545V5P4_9HYPO|nr:hypothetical protein IF1G_04272 [Cordyceps javanica]
MQPIPICVPLPIITVPEYLGGGADAAQPGGKSPGIPSSDRQYTCASSCGFSASTSCRIVPLYWHDKANCKCRIGLPPIETIASSPLLRSLDTIFCHPVIRDCASSS